MTGTTMSNPDGTTQLAGAPLPPGVQVTRQAQGLVVLYYPMPGWLPATVALLPTRGRHPATVHVRCYRPLAADEDEDLRLLLAAAEAWREAQPAPEGPAGQQLLGT